MKYFDCHADTLTEIAPGESLLYSTSDVDLTRIGRFAEQYTQIFAIWKDERSLDMNSPENAFIQLYQKAVSLLAEVSDRMIWCRTGREMELAHQNGKAAAFLSIEDAAIMGSQAERMKELGFAFALLTWNYENCYGCGAAAGQEKGLTGRGKELVKMLTSQGIVLDISHLSDRGAEDIFEMSDAPVIASHSNVRAVRNHPRNLQKSQIQELIRRQGLIGMNYYADFVGEHPSVSDLIRHMDVILELGGENVIALGGDFDGCGGLFPEGIKGVESVPVLVREMEKAGFGNELIDKIMSENGKRFILEKIE